MRLTTTIYHNITNQCALRCYTTKHDTNQHEWLRVYYHGRTYQYNLTKAEHGPMTEKSHVSLEINQCPVCTNKFDTGAILLDKRLQDSLERETLTGLGICPDCQTKLDDNFIALIEVDNPPDDSKERLQIDEANRTGNIAWLKRHIAERMFQNVNLEGPFFFIDKDVFKQLTAVHESLLNKEKHGPNS